MSNDSNENTVRAIYLDAWTTSELEAILKRERVVVLVPVGSTEPHGPHLPLATDAVISEEVCRRSLGPLRAKGITALIGPTLPFGVTEFAQGFAGAIGLSPTTLTLVLSEMIGAYLKNGCHHVCLVNNHLEPAHDQAIRASITPYGNKASVACPLERRFGKTLSAEYKSGACHAGEYETSLVMAAERSPRSEVRAHDHLAKLSLSLSEGIRAGKHTFRAIGMNNAYTGDPASASKNEGDSQYERLVDMVVTTVTESLSTP